MIIIVCPARLMLQIYLVDVVFNVKEPDTEKKKQFFFIEKTKEKTVFFIEKTVFYRKNNVFYRKNIEKSENNRKNNFL